jgi:hypothetical protein
MDWGCWSNYKWEVDVRPYQLEHQVTFFDCIFTIPSMWNYVQYENGEGYIAYDNDTMYCRKDPLARVWFLEMTEYSYNGDDDSIETARKNERVHQYNDSLHNICPEMVTHTRTIEKTNDAFIERTFPKHGVTSHVRWEFSNDRCRFLLESTDLPPSKQEAWKKVLESWTLKFIGFRFSVSSFFGFCSGIASSSLLLLRFLP